MFSPNSPPPRSLARRIFSLCPSKHYSFTLTAARQREAVLAVVACLTIAAREDSSLLNAPCDRHSVTE